MMLKYNIFTLSQSDQITLNQGETHLTKDGYQHLDLSSVCPLGDLVEGSKVQGLNACSL
jgi:hypothetical protein